MKICPTIRALPHGFGMRGFTSLRTASHFLLRCFAGSVKGREVRADCAGFSLLGARLPGNAWCESAIEWPGIRPRLHFSAEGSSFGCAPRAQGSSEARGMKWNEMHCAARTR